MNPNIAGNVKNTSNVGSNSEYRGRPNPCTSSSKGPAAPPLFWTTGGSSVGSVACPPSVAASRSASASALAPTGSVWSDRVGDGRFEVGDRGRRHPPLGDERVLGGRERERCLFLFGLDRELFFGAHEEVGRFLAKRRQLLVDARDLGAQLVALGFELGDVRVRICLGVRHLEDGDVDPDERVLKRAVARVVGRGGERGDDVVAGEHVERGDVVGGREGRLDRVSARPSDDDLERVVPVEEVECDAEVGERLDPVDRLLLVAKRRAELVSTVGELVDAVAHPLEFCRQRLVVEPAGGTDPERPNRHESVVDRLGARERRAGFEPLVSAVVVGDVERVVVVRRLDDVVDDAFGARHRHLAHALWSQSHLLLRGVGHHGGLELVDRVLDGVVEALAGGRFERLAVGTSLGEDLLAGVLDLLAGVRESRLGLGRCLLFGLGASASAMISSASVSAALIRSSTSGLAMLLIASTSTSDV
jgi:hypothetical protein